MEQQITNKIIEIADADTGVYPFDFQIEQGNLTVCVTGSLELEYTEQFKQTHNSEAESKLTFCCASFKQLVAVNEAGAIVHRFDDDIINQLLYDYYEN